ncbi:MAG: DUF6702 family protein [Flavobacteriales bacterium]
MYYLFSLFFSLSVLLPIPHEHYVSITTIEYNQESKSLEISIQLTGHDVEFALEKMGYGELKLGSKNENRMADNILFKYVKQNFEIQADGVKNNLYWVGKEIGNNDVLWIYLEIQGLKKPKSLFVFNKLLLEYFPAQQNITHVKITNTIQSATFGAHLTEKEFEI